MDETRAVLDMWLVGHEKDLRLASFCDQKEQRKLSLILDGWLLRACRSPFSRATQEHIIVSFLSLFLFGQREYKTCIYINILLFFSCGLIRWRR